MHTVKLIFAHIDEPVPAAFRDYAKLQKHSDFPLSERQSRKWKSRRLAHFLLNQLCFQHQIERHFFDNIQKTTSGRPYLAHPAVDFNISHSGDWVALLFAYGQPKIAVGVDIEHPQKERRYQQLLAYYADPIEIKEIEQGDLLPQLDNFSQRFYLSWCLREAVLKAQGVGIVKLTEVRHSLSKQQIISTHCPQGKLFFYDSLPFHLACFIEQEKSLLLAPEIIRWQAGQYHTIPHLNPIIYQVN